MEGSLILRGRPSHSLSKLLTSDVADLATSAVLVSYALCCKNYDFLTFTDLPLRFLRSTELVKLDFCIFVLVSFKVFTITDECFFLNAGVFLAVLSNYRWTCGTL